MDILNSDWLIKMLEKSSQKPHVRLLALFDILGDWLDLLNLESLNIESRNARAQIQSPTFVKTKHKNLLEYLTIQAKQAGVAMPEILANQLYFMATSAINHALQANGLAGSGHAFLHAKSAANALILAQTKKQFHVKKSSAYAMAASFMGVIALATSWFMLQNSNTPVLSAEIKPQIVVETAPTASPEQTAALIAQLELMRHGSCQLIEAIQLPDSQKGIYINMIVNGQVSTDPKEQAIAFDLLSRTRCNYTPMLMANSTG